MPTLIIVLRTVSLLAFAAPLLLGVSGRRTHPKTPARERRGGRAPVVANFAAFAVFFPSLLVFSGSSEGFTALLLASSGSLLAIAGAALVFRSRAELGPAWSFVPMAGQGTGLVTTGPYRLVRHPIYLGLALLAMGQALAFSSGPAFLIVLCGIVPTFAWRARTEETLLSRAFGESYALYRRHTKVITPVETVEPGAGSNSNAPPFVDTTVRRQLRERGWIDAQLVAALFEQSTELGERNGNNDDASSSTEGRPEVENQ